jgi:hypothetical protein
LDHPHSGRTTTPLGLQYYCLLVDSERKYISSHRGTALEVYHSSTQDISMWWVSATAVRSRTTVSILALLLPGLVGVILADHYHREGVRGFPCSWPRTCAPAERRLVRYGQKGENRTRSDILHLAISFLLQTCEHIDKRSIRTVRAKNPFLDKVLRAYFCPGTPSQR